MIMVVNDRNLLDRLCRKDRVCRVRHQSCMNVSQDEWLVGRRQELRISIRQSFSRVSNLHYRDCIIVEDCRNVFRGELVCRVADEKARLTNSTVANHDTSVGICQILSRKDVVVANGGRIWATQVGCEMRFKAREPSPNIW